jgi:hypothetical protein
MQQSFCLALKCSLFDIFGNKVPSKISGLRDLKLYDLCSSLSVVAVKMGEATAYRI